MLRLASLPVLLLVAAVAVGCNRRIEPFDPNEKPHAPDLSKIFPEGAEQAAKLGPGLPAPPGRAPAGAPPFAAQAGGAEASGPQGQPISGTIRIAENLHASIPRGAVLFLIARRGSAGPPLAVKRIQNPSFPLDFSIGPDDRMIKAMPFVGPIDITARVDADGNAMSRSPGDLEGAAKSSVEPGATGVDVLLDKVL